MIFLYFFILMLSFAGIYWSAEHMLNGAIETAHKHNISLVVIGVVVVGFGTSAPEILVSALGAASGSSDIALGNLLGSNFTNIALVMGTTAMLSVIVCSRTIVYYYLTAVFSLAVVGLFLWLRETLTVIDGLIMLGILIFCLFIMIRIAWQSDGVHGDEVIETQKGQHCLLKLFGGLIALLAVSELTVWSSIRIATLLNIDDLIIALTIVAVGTSLPELLASVLSALRRQHSIAVGNLIGSNIFNSVGGVGFSALVAPLTVSPAIVDRDFIVVFSLTLLFGILMFLPRRLHIGRLKGMVLLLCFVSYLGLLYSSAKA